jgi:hypothetical protein
MGTWKGSARLLEHAIYMHLEVAVHQEAKASDALGRPPHQT